MLGDNYWSGSCNEYFLTTSFTINDLSGVQYLRLVRATFDDWIRVKLNGNIVFIGPYSFSDVYAVWTFFNGAKVCEGRDCSSSSWGCQCIGRSAGCELGTNWNMWPNIDLKPYLRQGRNDVEIKVIVSGLGEGYVYIEGLVSDFQCNDGNCNISNSQDVCPSGYIFVGGYCKKELYTNPSCPGGGNFDGNADVCWVNSTKICPSGTTLNTNLDKCTSNPWCSDNGTLDTVNDRCYIQADPQCPSNWSFDSANSICYQSVNCDYVFNSSTDRCEATVSENCGTYTYSAAEDLCIKDITCPVDSGYDTQLDVCLSETEHNCPSGSNYTYTWSSAPVNKCELVPICMNGVYNPDNDKCFVGDYSCPLGGQYSCVKMEDENYYCSDLFCGDALYAGNYENLDTPEGANDKQADGQFDDSGNCLGTIYIFNGQDMRCRPPGVQTGFSDCCKKTTTWLGLGQCTAREQILSKLRTTNKGKDYTQADAQCHYVGSYCAEKWLGTCVQRKKTYCCFGSVLARIVHEQGRSQIGLSWGTPEEPICRGFTPSELQSIDFGKIDFSEYEEFINSEVDEYFKPGQIQENMKGKIQEFYDTNSNK